MVQAVPVRLAGSLWTNVVRVKGKCKLESPREMCWGHLQGRESPPKLHNHLSHAVPAVRVHGQPDSHFPVTQQRNQTSKEKIHGQGHTPRPDWGPALLQQGGKEKQPVTQGAGSPCIFPRRLGLPGTSAPVPLRCPASGCPELAFPNPVWKMLFI